jgi:hypothetical protein
MLMTQVMYVFYAVRHHQGLTLEELGKTLYDEFGRHEAIRFMMNDGKDTSLIKSRLQDIGCVVEREGRYVYDPQIRPLSRDPMTAFFLQHQLDAESARLKRDLAKPKEGD